ncbi:type II toxin-antitoxin system VapB family antitoxin [Jannaschia sp. LMIT008]|uniref:type II toxin-antitoxin system VapB family antitoxin n=1 Tax=Jannaschia maritima TaxID=3032585 RepID=UPI0028124235|nr:type II toxin-antitoxin system VapB family antitoxin [Jannaschia sp. LMIT008]
MRTTVTLDDKLMRDAMEMTGIENRSQLIQKALRDMMHMEASRRLALMGGSDPNAEAPPRRRYWETMDPE